jgi:hypothetical protein
MIVRGRSTTALCLSVISFLFTPAIAKQATSTPPYPHASHAPVPRLTCDRAAIDRDSYELATIGQARALLTDRSDFWDAFRINRHISALRDLNLDSEEIAQRALELDPGNMMAHSLLARQYTIMGWDSAALQEWSNVIDAGGVVVWTATLYDVDYKSYFLVSFGRDALRIYRMGQFTGSILRHRGHASFPEPTATRFYEAAAGCPDAATVPIATIPWSHVNEVRSGNWVLWFKLNTPVTVVSDRQVRKTIREVKVNLHGATGEVKMLAEANPDYDGPSRSDREPYKNVRGIGLGPWEYNRRTRDMVLRFADPAGHIEKTSSGKGAGW